MISRDVSDGIFGKGKGSCVPPACISVKNGFIYIYEWLKDFGKIWAYGKRGIFDKGR
jgi:hypothetical protein